MRKISNRVVEEVGIESDCAKLKGTLIYQARNFPYIKKISASISDSVIKMVSGLGRYSGSFYLSMHPNIIVGGSDMQGYVQDAIGDMLSEFVDVMGDVAFVVRPRINILFIFEGGECEPRYFDSYEDLMLNIRREA